MTAVLLLILPGIADLYYFSTSALIALTISTVSSTMIFAGLAIYKKNITRMNLILSALLGFFVTLPLSALLGPTGAVLVGAAVGFGMYAAHGSFRRNIFILITVLAAILAAIVVVISASLQ